MHGKNRGAYEAVLHTDLDGTLDHFSSDQLIKLIFDEFCAWPPFAVQRPYIEQRIKQVYASSGSAEEVKKFAYDLSRRFVDTGMKIDFMRESIGRGVDKWRAIDDIHYFFEEKLRSLAVLPKWNSGEFGDALHCVNNKYQLTLGTRYSTEVNYNPSTRKITAVIPTVLRMKMSHIVRDLKRAGCLPGRFVFIGDTPQEEPYAAQMASLAIWLSDKADLRLSKAKTNLKIPEAKTEGLSILLPHIENFLQQPLGNRPNNNPERQKCLIGEIYKQ